MNDGVVCSCLGETECLSPSRCGSDFPGTISRCRLSKVREIPDRPAGPSPAESELPRRGFPLRFLLFGKDALTPYRKVFRLKLTHCFMTEGNAVEVAAKNERHSN